MSVVIYKQSPIYKWVILEPTNKVFVYLVDS